MSLYPVRPRIVFMESTKVCEIMEVARHTGGMMRLDEQHRPPVAYVEYVGPADQDEVAPIAAGSPK